MEQLLAHLVGDYLFYDPDLARDKGNNIGSAMLHAFLYTLPFLFLCGASPLQAFVIWMAHGLQDRWLWGAVGNGKHLSGLEAAVIIVQDNTLHLLTNYFVLAIM